MDIDLYILQLYYVRWYSYFSICYLRLKHSKKPLGLMKFKKLCSFLSKFRLCPCRSNPCGLSPNLAHWQPALMLNKKEANIFKLSLARGYGKFLLILSAPPSLLSFFLLSPVAPCSWGLLYVWFLVAVVYLVLAGLVC